MERKGEITLFLAMILLSVCALLCGITESARTAGARWYLRTAMNASMDSLMAQYHRELWGKYRVFGLEHRDSEMLEDEMKEFLNAYLKAENWYPMEISQMEAKDVAVLTDGGGRYLEQEILDYMKYGLAGVLWDEMDGAQAEELLASLKEAGNVRDISDLYSDHTKEAVKLEQSLEKLEQGLKAQREQWEQAGKCLEDLDGDGFVKHAKKAVKELERVPSLVDEYEKKADKLGQKLKESRKTYEGKEDLSEQMKMALEEEIGQYEAYTAEDGARRKEVVSLKETSAKNISYIQSVIEEAESVMDYIDQWEPDDEDDSLDEEALWSPVKSRWNRYPVLTMGVKFGIEDKEKEGLLERAGDMAGNGLLKLVLPEGTVVSGRTLDLSQAPSAEFRKSSSDPSADLLEKLLIGEYAVRFFPFFQKETSENGQYELEYIICGEKKDKENLTGVVARLLAVREGLNLVHIFSDAGKRQEARALATAIAGAVGLFPLVSVLTFFIMSVWALGEAIMDIKCLLNGEKIPLIKSAGDWKLDLEGLLKMGKDQAAADMGDSRDHGLDYRGYLRILLFSSYDTQTVYRMMDMMQLNIRKDQPDFLMKRCAGSVDMEADVSGKHVFFSIGLWKSQAGDSPIRTSRFTYDTAMAVSGSYLAD